MGPSENYPLPGWLKSWAQRKTRVRSLAMLNWGSSVTQKSSAKGNVDNMDVAIEWNHLYARCNTIWIVLKRMDRNIMIPVHVWQNYFKLVSGSRIYWSVSGLPASCVLWVWILGGHRGDYLLTSLMSRNFSILAVYRTREQRELMNNNRNCTFGWSNDL